MYSFRVMTSACAAGSCFAAFASDCLKSIAGLPVLLASSLLAKGSLVFRRCALAECPKSDTIVRPHVQERAANSAANTCDVRTPECGGLRPRTSVLRNVEGSADVTIVARVETR